MRQVAPRIYPPPAAGHPLITLGPAAVRNLRIDITPVGWGEYQNLYAWSVRVVIDAATVVEQLPTSAVASASSRDPFGQFDDPSLLATMKLHSLDLWGHSVVDSADAESGELEALVTSAFALDNEPRPELEEAMNASSRFEGWMPDRMMTIDEFAVSPRWSGTVLTPYLTAAILSAMAAMGRDSFVLTAHPMLHGNPGGLTEVQIQRAQTAIVSMYRSLGFRQYDDQCHMAGWFPEHALDAIVQRLEREHSDLLTEPDGDWSTAPS